MMLCWSKSTSKKSCCLSVSTGGKVDEPIKNGTGTYSKHANRWMCDMYEEDRQVMEVDSIPGESTALINFFGKIGTIAHCQ